MSQDRVETADRQAPASPPRRPIRVWAGRLAGITFGLLLGWLLAEVLLRLMFFSLPPRLQLVLAEVHKTPFTDSRLLPDPIWEPDREYLIQTRPVQNQVQYGSAEVRFTVTTNTLWGSHLAFRTRQDLVDSHVDGVAVGDSFTFCFTDEADCWVWQLGQMTKRNLINLGITSTGAVSHQRVLINFGLPLQPALVLWQWFGNDANEDYGLAQLNGETTITSPVPPPPIPKRSWWDDNSALYTLLKLYLGPADDYDATLQFHAPYYAKKGDVRLSFGEPYLLNAFDMSQPHNQYGWTRSQAAMLDARDRVEDYGGTILFILMPTKEQVYRDMAAPLLGPDKMAMIDGPYAWMQDFCTRENLTCLDLLPVFQEYAQAGEQVYFTTDMHINPRGNTILAETLAAWLDAHPDVFAAQP